MKTSIQRSKENVKFLGKTPDADGSHEKKNIRKCVSHDNRRNATFLVNGRQNKTNLYTLDIF